MADAFADMMQQFQGMQTEMERMKAALRTKTVDASSGPVRIVMNGHLEVVSASLAGDYARDPRKLEEDIKAAVNSAIVKSQEMVAREVGLFFGPGAMLGGSGGVVNG